MKKNCYHLLVLVLVLSLILMPSVVGAWSNLRYESRSGDNYHKEFYGRLGHYKYQSSADYSPSDIGTYYNYGNHDFILERAMDYIDVADNGVRDYSAFTVIESHLDWDIALSHTDNPDYDYHNFSEHYWQPNDDPGASWAGYPDGEDVFRNRGAAHFIERMIEVYIAYAKLYKATGDIFYKDAALETLGSLAHVMGDLSNPFHTSNMIVYNHTYNKSGQDPLLDDKPAGVGGPMWWEYNYGSGSSSIHSEYEYTTSQYDIMDYVNAAMANNYNPQDITTGIKDFVINFATEINEGWGYYPVNREHYTIEVNYDEDIYDKDFPVELRNPDVTYAQDGYETTPNVGAQVKDLLHSYYVNLRDGVSNYGQDGYDAHIMEITQRIHQLGAYRMADLLQYAENRIKNESISAAPVVAIVGWENVDVGLERNVTGIGDLSIIEAPRTIDLIGFAVNDDGPCTFTWKVNGQVIGSGTMWVHPPQVAYSDRNGTGYSWNTGETNGNVFMGYTFDSAGTYTITLEVTDGNGNIGTDSITVEVR
ncbi:hypothetical protein BBF96_00840 [Anoxybacter fermentans]|uniref:PKD domain-containing protein n=1 Tax=Anoxybacter fermentans TaxID=1323375 RepID=A0A3S9SUV8_9FIRM|nr:hypothetical protein [Anoxybacter fermentans]AZR72062.1 hypothetical protein BBF96_00840 [Anoxybacter fermentans]